MCPGVQMGGVEPFPVHEPRLVLSKARQGLLSVVGAALTELSCSRSLYRQACAPERRDRILALRGFPASSQFRGVLSFSCCSRPAKNFLSTKEIVL